uniref:Uncharacterized protein n=1 Tax=Stegastes partitus TaxID=144197 RepID=A0A3B4YY38_9TELE
MLSMASPFSSFFSISTISLTPSTTSWTWYTSEEPRRSALEMSNTPPTEAVSTPPEEEGKGMSCRKEHGDSTQEDPGCPHQDANRRPSSCETTVLTTT